eukprot:TRINITY_DN11048_c0_g1_i12.p2 TRINITY_DN11048_c0_g1~~TRINITY_DN11048_c0_g1_i12.p2  ORF type:complete len:107 (+),score=7.23 TRINITY_DN11048_c0_g1_i12:318-638(+)
MLPVVLSGRVGPGSYRIPDAVGQKLVSSLQSSSAAYSFGREKKEDSVKVTDIVKEMREKSLPRENPGPAQYRSESLHTKPKSPSAVMTQANRFSCFGSFFRYKVVV